MSDTEGFDWDADSGEEGVSVALLPDPNDKRSLWRQSDLDKLQAGPSYPHTQGPPSGRSQYASAPGADQARAAFRKLGQNRAAQDTHYDRNSRSYVSNEVSGNLETFALVKPPYRIEPGELPMSPKRVYNAAVKLGWDVRAWLSIGEVPAVLFLAASDDHEVGDIRFSGYSAHVFTIEAADRAIKLGFKATFMGKQYPDGRKASAGAFESALVADPAGIPTPLSYDYPPIPVRRGTMETAASFAKRERIEVDRSAILQRDMNGGTYWITRRSLNTAKTFDAWLAEWMDFA